MLPFPFIEAWHCPHGILVHAVLSDMVLDFFQCQFLSAARYIHQQVLCENVAAKAQPGFSADVAFLQAILH